MAFLEINRDPNPRQLRQFGLMFLLALPALGWLLWPARWDVVGWLALTGGIVAVVAWLVPWALKPAFLILSWVALPIGLVVGEVVMLLTFFGIFLPLGIVFRLIGRDSLRRKFDSKADTYWSPQNRPTSSASYFRQF